MIKKIFKYELQFSGTTVNLPAGSNVISANMQDGKPKIWIESSNEGGFEARKFQVFGTGFDIPKEATHISTLVDGMFVWHIYETTRC